MPTEKQHKYWEAKPKKVKMQKEFQQTNGIKFHQKLF